MQTVYEQNGKSMRLWQYERLGMSKYCAMRNKKLHPWLTKLIMLHNFYKIILFNNYTFNKDIITSSDGIKNTAKQSAHYPRILEKPYSYNNDGKPKVK
jgi:hypothetical protein